jgi:uncharacterized protein (TIGR02594 family)
MLPVIEAATDMTPFIDTLQASGVTTIIRYYHGRNPAELPKKRLEEAEAEALADAGFALAVVFQQDGGGGRSPDLTAEAGARDASKALELAKGLGQPEGSAIYFAVDSDPFRAGAPAAVAAYFAAVRKALGTRYRVGVHGSGTVGARMADLGHADLIWLAGARGWSGARDLLATDRWALFRRVIERTDPAGFAWSGHEVSPAHPDFGQFRLGVAAPAARTPAPAGMALAEPAVAALAGAPEAAAALPVAPKVLMQVAARSGLNLRRGPGRDFESIRTLDADTIVTALSREGDWVKVDLEGDGIADGFMHGGFLATVSGGFPIPVTAGASPYDIAKAELALDVREMAGAGINPRLLLYHAETTLKSTSDGVAWCSCFVNYCVAQAGMTGTRSAGARSWHDRAWGRHVTNAPQEGDIAVFGRTDGDGRPAGGHVGFFMADLGDSIRVLGGNQGNRVKIEDYPKDGKLGAFTYRLLSIRRP